jgi:hypothetical protein
MEIKSVLPKDAIPSIDEPEFGEQYIGDAADEVIVLDGDPAKAYPLRILNYHEIVNDEVDGRPVAVTWCPLCGSAVVYDRRVDGGTLTFGVSGKLADDDLVMYDRETDSEWKQSLGEAISGPHEGADLDVLPASVSTYGQFRDQNPSGVVLQPVETRSEAASDTDEPAEISYDDAPYRDYFESDGFGLGAHRGSDGREWEHDEIEPKAVVIGVETGDAAVGFPRERVAAAGGVVTATVGDTEVVVFATDDGIHAFEQPGFEFSPDGAGFRADGSHWDGATGESEDGRALERVPSRRLFAFAWVDDHGIESLYTGPDTV